MKLHNPGETWECIKWLDALPEGAKVEDAYGLWEKRADGMWVEHNPDDPEYESPVDSEWVAEEVIWPAMLTLPD